MFRSCLMQCFWLCMGYLILDITPVVLHPRILKQTEIGKSKVKD